MIRFTYFILLIAITGNTELYAQWTSDLSENTPVSEWSDDTPDMQLVSDGNGGAYFAWIVDENELYVQHLDKNGFLLWGGSHGERICDLSNYSKAPEVIVSSNEHIITVWDDRRDGLRRIYAQKINSQGESVWTNNGIQICAFQSTQAASEAISDGQGGAFVVWEDDRETEGVYQIYAQRINSDGQALWNTNGVCVSKKFTGTSYPQIVADGANGIIITYQQNMADEHDIYAQRLNSNGEKLWVTATDSSGIAVCLHAGFQYEPVIAENPAGGCFISWLDRRADEYLDLYIQSLNADGEILWANDGIPVCTSPASPTVPYMLNDGAGGVLIAWSNYDGYSYNRYDAFIQRISSSGELLWNNGSLENGLQIHSDTTGNQSDSYLMPDGEGGFFVSWDDSRLGEYNIYAQRMDLNGNKLWSPASGKPISIARGDQVKPILIKDSDDGLIAVWIDYREGWGDADIFCQQMDKNGNPATIAGIKNSIQQDDAIAWLKNQPNPFQQHTSINWHTTVSGTQIIQVFDIAGRKISTPFHGEQPVGDYSLHFDASDMPAGIYFLKFSVAPQNTDQEISTRLHKMVITK